MGTSRRHFAIAWVALVAQVVAAALGPSGLLLCREADGSTHYEWVGEHCCSDGSVIDPSSATTVESAGDWSQTCIGCVDDQVGQIPAVSKSRPTTDSESPELFLAHAPVGVLSDLLLDGSVAADSPTLPSGEGPPTQVLRALRATVLLL